MWSRQIGHFFFEPKGYDSVNGVSFEHKEEVKVGYNLQRKVVLLCVWLSVPALLAVSPRFFGLWSDSEPVMSSVWVDRLGVLWLWLAAIGLLARTLWLCFTRSVQTGVVWFAKILTDPFHDVMLYHRAPLYLLKGQRLDPMLHAQEQQTAEHG